MGTSPFALIVPCYQEEAALERFAALLPRLAAEAIVFVDDGSRDATPQRLAALAASDRRVRVLTHEENRGVGAAMRTGLAAAPPGIAVVYDADRTYPSEDIARLVALVEGGADLATASPLAPEGALDQVPAFRRWLTRAAAWCYRRVLGRRARGLSTFTCAFRAYGPRARAVVAPTADGFAAAAEMIGRALLAGLTVVEHPARLSARTEGVSKMRVGRALLGHLGALGRLLGLRLGGRGGRVTGP